MADTKALNDLIASTLALLAQFTASFSTAAADAQPIADPPNPLHVARDASKLLKAHTTKLSLLAINKPFTPSAITKVLRELSSTCLPAMMSAVQICDQEQAIWGSFLGKELRVRIQRAFREVEVLLKEVQAIGQGSNGSAARRDSLASTGVVWESCDAIIQLEQMGVAGLAVEKAEQWRDTIKDAIEELREWAEGEDPDNEGQRDALVDSDDEGVDGEDESIEDIFNAANSLPKDRPELKKLVEEAQEKLKKVVILYNALIKRRLKTFKQVPANDAADSSVDRLDKLMFKIKIIPHQVDELASNFYDLDEETVATTLAKCLQTAKDSATLVSSDYDGKDDEFTSWSKKWHDAVS